jgi:hypothetical protein
VFLLLLLLLFSVVTTIAIACCPLLLWLPQKQLQTVTSVSSDAEHSSNSEEE